MDLQTQWHPVILPMSGKAGSWLVACSV